MHQRTQITVGIFKQFHSKEFAGAQNCQAGDGAFVLLWLLEDLVWTAL
jgi:hypothetical protein